MYTRLYWAINQREDLEFNLFHDSLAGMKRGFEDIIRNYPHSALDINTFAAVACIAVQGHLPELKVPYRQDHHARGVAIELFD